MYEKWPERKSEIIVYEGVNDNQVESDEKGSIPEFFLHVYVACVLYRVMHL